MTELLNKLQTIFRSTFRKEDLVITTTTSAQDIDNWDSLSHVLLLSEIEKEFNIQFELDELISFKTVEDILNSIASKNGN